MKGKMSGMSLIRNTNVFFPHILHFQRFLLVSCLALHKHHKWDVKSKHQESVKRQMARREENKHLLVKFIVYDWKNCRHEMRNLDKWLVCIRTSHWCQPSAMTATLSISWSLRKKKMLIPIYMFHYFYFFLYQEKQQDFAVAQQNNAAMTGSQRKTKPQSYLPADEFISHILVYVRIFLLWCSNYTAVTLKRPGCTSLYLSTSAGTERCLTLDVNNNEAVVPVSSIIPPPASLLSLVRGAPALPGVWRHSNKASAAWESRGRLGSGCVYRYTGELWGAEVVGTTHSAHAPASDNPTKHAQNTRTLSVSLSIPTHLRPRSRQPPVLGAVWSSRHLLSAGSVQTRH